MQKIQTTGKGQLESVANALAILRSLKTNPVLRVTDVSRALSLSPSTAHRLLSTMRDAGFLEQGSVDRAYRAGWELIEMGLENAGQLEVREKALPVLEALRDETEETANLVMLEGRYIRFIAGVESRNPVRVATRIGQRTEAHTTAAGKILLAERSSAFVRSLYEHDPAPATKLNTSSKIDAFLSELSTARNRGYATNFGESVADLHAVGVKVLDHEGRSVAALTISAPSHRLRQAHAPAIAAALLLASTDLTGRAWPQSGTFFRIAETIRKTLESEPHSVLG